MRAEDRIMISVDAPVVEAPNMFERHLAREWRAGRWITSRGITTQFASAFVPERSSASG